VLRLDLVAPAPALPEGFSLAGNGLRLSVSSCSVRGRDSLLVGFEGVAGLEAAEQLRGTELSASRADVLAVEGLLPAGLFTGMRVTWSRGRGVVAGVDLDSGNPLLRVGCEGSEFPLPVAMALSGEVDWKAGEIRLELPEGLTELEAGF